MGSARARAPRVPEAVSASSARVLARRLDSGSVTPKVMATGCQRSPRATRK